MLQPRQGGNFHVTTAIDRPRRITLLREVATGREAYLERKFGDEYVRYRQSVRRWL